MFCFISPRNDRTVYLRMAELIIEADDLSR